MVVMAAAAAAVTVAVAATTEFNTSQCLRYIQPLCEWVSVRFINEHTDTHLLRVCGGWQICLGVCIYVRASVCVSLPCTQSHSVLISTLFVFHVELNVTYMCMYI